MAEYNVRLTEEPGMLLASLRLLMKQYNMASS